MVKQEREEGWWVCWHLPLTLDRWLPGPSVWESIVHPRYFEGQSAHPPQGSGGQCTTSPSLWVFSLAKALCEVLASPYFLCDFGLIQDPRASRSLIFVSTYFLAQMEMWRFQSARLHPCHDGSRLDSCLDLASYTNWIMCLLLAVFQAAFWK